MAPASLRARGLLHESADTSETAPPLDLDLRLGPPVVVAPRSDDAGVVSLDHAPAHVPRRKALENGGNYVEQWAGMVSKGDAANEPAPMHLGLFSLQPYAFDDAQSHEADEEEAAVESGRKRGKSEPPPPPSVVSAPAPLLVQPPRAPAAAAAQRRDARGAQEETDAGATEPAWVRAELLPRHGFPADLPLHFVEDKIMQDSDLKPNQNRLLITCAASNRLRALLSADELEECGDDGSGHRRTRPPAAAATTHGAQGGGRKRAVQVKYPGVPVLVHQRDVERRATALKLNTFHSTAAMIVNGAGYRDIVEGSGFRKRDRVEVWAFRRPHDQKLCLVVAKRDGNRRSAIN